MPVIWGSTTGLNVLIMKSLVSTRLDIFDQTSMYLKVVAFLSFTFLECKSFLKIVYICDRVCPLKDLVISYKLSSQSFVQSC